MAISLTSHEGQKILEPIKTIYSDLDGTLLGKGGCLITNSKEKLSLDLAKAVIKSHKAGLEVCIVTGRTRKEVNEICRLLNFPRFAAEMGAVLQSGRANDAKITYNTGEMDHDPEDGKPIDKITESGIIGKMVERWPDTLEAPEYANDGREVSYALFGNIDIHKAQNMLDTLTIPLEIVDNGVVSSKGHDLDVEVVHVYHVLPKNVTKLSAVQTDQILHGIDPATAISIGDSSADIDMANACAAGVAMKNGFASKLFSDKVKQARVPMLATTKPGADGWVEFIDALTQ